MSTDQFFYTPGIRTWCDHKSHDYIAAGLNENCSLMNRDMFRLIRKQSNAVEATHFKSNSLGRQLTPLKAVQK